MKLLDMRETITLQLWERLEEKLPAVQSDAISFQLETWELSPGHNTIELQTVMAIGQGKLFFSELEVVAKQNGFHSITLEAFPYSDGKGNTQERILSLIRWYESIGFDWVEGSEEELADHFEELFEDEEDLSDDEKVVGIHVMKGILGMIKEF